ncbi:MAG TPA: acyl-CoA dehydrogenase family protein, partial [Aggregatilineales bacterium]|nr:acyl-CoA dehydrogenase family protein [Aggregatilineales bacterium]
PFEKDPRWDNHGIPEDMRRDLNKVAKEAGLLAINSPEEFGGKGFSHFEQAVIFEAAGYSILGPIALHFHAPDEGNIHMLINTPLGGQAHDDGALIRGTAALLGIPLVTTLSAAMASVQGIRALRDKPLKVRSLQKHHEVKG